MAIIDDKGQSQAKPQDGSSKPRNGRLWIDINEYGSAMEEGRIAWKAINKYTYRYDESIF